MRLLRGLTATALLGFCVWAAWWIAWYVGIRTAGSAVPPPPFAG